MEKELIEITDYEDPRLDVFARLNETQLRHYYAPNGGLFIAESPRVTARALAAGCQPLSALVERSQASGEAAEVLESLPDIPVFTGSSQTIRQLTNIPMTRGLLCCMRRPALRVTKSDANFSWQIYSRLPAFSISNGICGCKKSNVFSIFC